MQKILDYENIIKAIQNFSSLLKSQMGIYKEIH